MKDGNCPICDSPSQLDVSANRGTFLHEVRCKRCWNYFIFDPAKDCIERALRMNKRDISAYLSIGSSLDIDPTTQLFVEIARKAEERGLDIPRSILSHSLSKRNDIGTPLTVEILTNVLKNNSLPTPAEQANNLIILLGKRLSSPGDSFAVLSPQNNQAKENIYGLLGIRTGAAEWRDLNFIILALEEQKILSVAYAPVSTVPLSVSLTMRGWQKFEELQRSVKDSRKAFVAMEFPSSERATENYFFQNTLLDSYLIPAVKQTGYVLANALRSEPMAGNIHARLELEIRAARFVVAELSHHNNGAYWEAGFARGLGKPVFYMYNKVVGNGNSPHFDVGSDLYIPWEQDKPRKAADDLKAVIRATLFGEAIMED